MKKNQAGQVVVAQLASKTDGSAVTTGPTSVYLSGDGGLQSLITTGSPEAQHLGNGVWAFYPSAGETNYDHVAFTFINSSAVPVTVQVWPSFPQTGDSYARIGAEVGSPSATISRDLYDLLAAVANNFARLGAPAGASVSADVAAIKAVLPAALAGGRMDASVGAMAANTLTASALATDAVTEIQTGLSTLDAAGVRAAVGLATANLDTQLTTIDDFLDTEVAAIKAKTDNLPSDPADASDIASAFGTVNASLAAIAAYVDTEVGAIKVVTDKLGTTLESIGSPADYVFTSAALSQAPSVGSAPSAAAIADAVWDEARSGHASAGTFGEGVASVQGNLTGSVGSVTGLTASDVGAIKTKTDNLPSDPADASDIASAFGTVNTSLGTVASYIDTEVAAIKAKTDNLPAAPAAVGDIPTASDNASAVWAFIVENSTSAVKLMRGFAAALLGKVSGAATTTAVFRDIGDTKDRITATVDADGNRSAVTTDLT